MLEKQLEYRLSKGTRKGEGVKSSVTRFRFKEIVDDLKNYKALTFDQKIHVDLERVPHSEKDKIRTILLSEKTKSSDVSPFADLPFGIRYIYRDYGPLHIEVAGDIFGRIPWILTVTILEAVCGYKYQWLRDVVYLPSSNGPKRMKNAGLLYENNELIATMCKVDSCDGKIILVRWLEGRKKIIVKYKIASAKSKNRLGEKYLVDYEMYCPPWIKQKAKEILIPFETCFKNKFELTLAETKKKLRDSSLMIINKK